MKRFLIVLGAVAAGLVMLAFIGLAARFVRDRNQRATEEEIRAEREADRAAARAAFAAPIAPTAAEAEEFGRFFQSLGEALDRGNEATVVDHFDADRMTSEFIRFGAFDRLGGRPSARDRAGMARGVRQGIGRTLVQNELLRWDSTQVRAVRWAADRREAVVIATHKNEVGGEETDAKVRWWLVRGPGAGWKAYDLEDLDVGSRLTQLGAAVVTPELVAEGAAGIARIQTATEATREALGAVLRRDADAADRALARARGQNLPIPVAALRELAEASLALVRLDHATTLTRLDEADRLLPGMPAVKLVRAAALNLAGRHEEALEQARGYLDELGPDALAYTHTGLALERLNRPDEAAADYRKALDTTPNQLDALFGLRRVLPADKKAEIGDRLANARDPLRDFDELIRDARDDGDAAGVTALLAGLRKARPDDPRVAEEEVRELVKGGRYAAAALVQRRLGNSPPGRTMPPVLTAYLGAMLGANRAAEAWGAGPPAHAGPSFNFLAEDLTDQLLDGDPKADESEATRDQLTALIAARRKQAPRDPWTWFFEASGHDAANRFDDAEKGFAAAAKALEDWDGEVSDADRDRFRSSRVYSLYRAKKGLTALEDVGPPDKTFRQLAWLYTGDKDADGLAALAAAHAAEAPDDRAVVYFRAEVHYIKAEYAAAARLYADYRRGAAENDDPRPMTAAEREVRARVRSGDAAGARRVASGLPPDWTGATLRAVSLAAAGDVAGLERLLEEQAKTPGGVGGLYYDEDFVRLFAAPAFADLRQRFPDPRPRPAGQPG